MARINYTRLVPLLAAVIVSTAGCTRTFPSQVTDRVDKSITFSDLMRDPGSYKGKWVMLAGDIVAARPEKDGSTYIEVLQRPADRRGRPLRTNKTEGRFIAVSKQFLDPTVYARGRVITIVGEVIGDSVKPLGAMVYRYPLLKVEVVHLWEPSYGPRYHVAVGVGVGFSRRY
jgi:outer membrane lipoprotein